MGIMENKMETTQNSSTMITVKGIGLQTSYNDFACFRPISVLRSNYDRE